MYFKSVLYALCVNTVLMIYLNKFTYFKKNKKNI